MNVRFSQTVPLPPDDKEILIELEASFVNGGIGAYECHGYRGTQNTIELDDIECKTPLSTEQKAFVNKLIEDGFFDELAYTTMEDHK